MATTTHPALELQRRFANGRLSLALSEQILEHLIKCDQCLKVMDALWSAKPENSAAALPAHVAQRLEQAILERIRRSR